MYMCSPIRSNVQKIVQNTPKRRRHIFTPKIFTANFFTPKNYFTPKSFFTPKFFTANFFTPKNLFYVKKLFYAKKTYSTPKSFLRQKVFFTPKKLVLRQFFQEKFCRKKIFWRREILS